MADHACFVFFSAGKCDLDDAASALEERGLTVKRKHDELEARFPRKPVLRVALATDDYVRMEAEELSVDSPFAATISTCDARFEVLIDDLDAVLDEINTIDVQIALQDLTRGFVLDGWTCRNR